MRTPVGVRSLHVRRPGLRRCHSVDPGGRDRPAPGDLDHPVGDGAHGGRVRGDHNGAAGVAQALQEVHERLFRLGIQRRAGLVEQQDRRIGVESTGQRQSLALAAGEIGTVLVQVREEALRQRLDEFQHADLAANPQDALHVGLVVARGKVLKHRAGEQVGLLRHHRHVPAQAGQLEIPEIHLSDQDFSLFRQIEPLKERQQRALAAAGLANQGGDLPCRKRERDVLKCRHPSRVFEGHVHQVDVLRGMSGRKFDRSLILLQFEVHDFEETIRRNQRFLNGGVESDQRRDGAGSGSPRACSTT